MFTQKNKIGILGAGAFGTSLAVMLSHFNSISLFSAFPEHVSSMREARENEFLKGVHLPNNIEIKTTSELNLDPFAFIFWCFPITPSLELLLSFKDSIKKEIPIIICSKGITSAGTFLQADFSKLLPENCIGVMSGPDFAIEVAACHPSAADLAFADLALSTHIASSLSNQFFKLFPTDDVIGVQVAGAMKNIIAIACGILVGLHAGQNAVASLLTYGLQEISKVGEELGARKNTFYGLSGVGDLILTATSETSRNMKFGKRLGEGETAESILQNTTAVSEGVMCAQYLAKIASHAPICKKVLAILSGEEKTTSILEILNATL